MDGTVEAAAQDTVADLPRLNEAGWRGGSEEEDRPGPGVKDPELYEALRHGGASTEKAARIANAAANSSRSDVGKRGGEAESYDKPPVKELRKRAAELDLEGRSSLRKEEFIDALRGHR